MQPELGDTVLYEPPEDNAEQHTMVGTVVNVELVPGSDPLTEDSYKLTLFIMRRNGQTGIATPLGFAREPKADHWRWRQARPHA